MKMNGVVILRISDFKRFFDFQEFWSQKQEFIELFNQEGYLDFFCNTEEEKILCNFILDWLKNNPSSGEQIARDLFRKTVKKIAGIDLRVWEMRQPIGLMSLSVLVSDTLCTDEVEGWLEIMRGNGLESNYYPLYENKEFECLDDVQFPLKARVIVNKTNQIISVNILGEKPKKLSAGGCIVGLFDADGGCYKLLPNVGYEGKLKFKLIMDKDLKTTKLIISGEPYNDFEFPLDTKIHKNQNGDIEFRYIDNVVSFITTQYGLAAVDMNGKVVFSTKWGVLRRKIDSFYTKYPMEKILCIESETDIITENRVY